MIADDRLIVALDVPNLLDGGKIIDALGDSVSFYKIGLGMLTGGGLALANELKRCEGFSGYEIFRYRRDGGKSGCGDCAI